MHSVKGKRFLVTGGTGFLGSALVRKLVNAGARVRSLDNDSRGSAARLGDVASDVELVTGDVRDRDTVVAAAKGMDSIAHLAYINGTEFFYTKPELVLDVAVRGMLAVLDACRANDVRELILASSSEAYQTPPRYPADETVPLVVPDPLNPRYSYGGGKLICELMAINYGRTGFDRVMIFRPHNAYGPNMGWEHVIPQLAVRMLRLARDTKGPLRVPIQGTGKETRAFVYVSDLVEGVLKMAEHGEHLGIYHVGTDVEVTIADLVREIGAAIGRDVEVVAGDLQPGGPLRRCPDITKLRGLGYSPTVPLSEGVRETVKWYAANLAHAPVTSK